MTKETVTSANVVVVVGRSLHFHFLVEVILMQGGRILKENKTSAESFDDDLVIVSLLSHSSLPHRFILSQ